MRYKIIKTKIVNYIEQLEIIDRTKSKKAAEAIIDEEKTSDLIHRTKNKYGIYDTRKGEFTWI